MLGGVTESVADNTPVPDRAAVVVPPASDVTDSVAERAPSSFGAKRTSIVHVDDGPSVVPSHVSAVIVKSFAFDPASVVASGPSEVPRLLANVYLCAGDSRSSAMAPNA
jgi:hypothetical protein